MLKFLASNNDGSDPIYGLGLTERNLELLVSGKPIVVDLKDLNHHESVKVMIFYGLDEQTMVKDLKDAGHLRPDAEKRTYKQEKGGH